MDPNKLEGMKMNLDVALKSAVARIGRVTPKHPKEAMSMERETVMCLCELIIVLGTLGHLLAPESLIVRPN